MININKIENDIIILSLDYREKPTNIINEKFIDHLETIIEEITRADQAKGLIITSQKKEFMAGADLKMIQDQEEANAVTDLSLRLNKTFRMMETWSKPVVAAINGTALGGGLELALACHHRIAVNHPRLRMGLPEVTLGLTPGGGGTQRLPRLIGIQASLPYLLEGKKITPLKAREIGLIDDLAESLEEMIEKAKAFISQNPETSQPWDRKGYQIPGAGIQSPKGYQILSAAIAMTKEKTYGNYPAPLNILSCIYEGLQLPIEQALQIESKYFGATATTPEAKNIIRTLFFSLNECKKGLERPKREAQKIKKIGILGAGMMGSGIAYASAKTGIEIVLKDTSKEIAEKGKAYSTQLLDKGIQRGHWNEEYKQKFLNLIQATDQISALEGCDLVIEAVIEDREIKAQVIQETEKVLADTAIFASNTSTLPITSLAQQSQKATQFIGLHFFSPVDKMPLVEIILGKETGDQALTISFDYVTSLGKIPIIVNDGRGFFTSRVFTTYITEGISCLAEGITPALIENAGKAAGMPIGPLAVADEISLDLIFHVLRQTIEDLNEEAIDRGTYQIVTKFVTQFKRLGKKSQKGFYEYPLEGKKILSPILSKEFPLQEKQPSCDEIQKRLLSIQVLETLRCIEDGILRNTRDADVGSLLGWGFPAYTGGVISYLDYRGIDNFLHDCQKFSEKYGKRFQPPKILIEISKGKQKNAHENLSLRFKE